MDKETRNVGNAIECLADDKVRDRAIHRIASRLASPRLSTSTVYRSSPVSQNSDLSSQLLILLNNIALVSTDYCISQQWQNTFNNIWISFQLNSIHQMSFSLKRSVFRISNILFAIEKNKMKPPTNTNIQITKNYLNKLKYSYNVYWQRNIISLI